MAGNRIFKATFEQRESWIYHHNLPLNNPYQILDFEMSFDSIDKKQLLDTLNYLFYLHDGLRTYFSIKEKELFQEIPPFKRECSYVEEIDFSADQQFSQSIAELKNNLKKEIDIREQRRLCRCLLVKTPAGYSAIFLIHHSIGDEWSIRILKKDIQDICNRIQKGDKLEYINKEKIGIIEYAGRQWKDLSEKSAKKVAFWNRYLHDIKEYISYQESLLNNTQIDIPISISSILNKTGSSAFFFSIDNDNHRVINNIKDKLKITTTTLLYGILILLFKKHFGKDKTLIASPVRNSFTLLTRSLVGCVGGSIYMYEELDENVTVTDFFKRIYLVLMNLLLHIIPDHRAYGIDGRLMREKTDIFLNIMPEWYEMEINKEDFENKYQKDFNQIFYGLELYVYEKPDAIYLKCGFSNAFYDKAEIEELASEIKKILTDLQNKLEEKLSSLINIP